ncbi:MAG: tetratricopeptide repeat protein [Anaerolineaceae bacterium]|nr:tetratricopeptide repeat protein [Anaerolineaceae bacterium]
MFLKSVPSVKSVVKLLLFLLCAILLVLRWNSLAQVASANALALRLNHASFTEAQTVDPGLLSLLQSPGFQTRSRNIAWWGGSLILKQTGSYNAAKKLWAMAPAYSANNLAVYSYAVTDKAESLEAARAAFAVDPARLEVKLALVEALISNEMWQEASEKLDEFLKEAPEDASFTAMRGYVEYKNDGSAKKAEQLLLRAKAQDPKLIRPYLYLVNYYQNFGTSDQVETVALEGLEVSTEAKSDYSYNFIGSLVDSYLREGKLDQVLPYLESGLGKFPQDPWWNNMAGEYYLKKGIYPLAIQHFTVALHTYQDPGIFVKWGDSYQGAGDLENARLAYCRALAINPEFPLALQHIQEMGAACP